MSFEKKKGKQTRILKFKQIYIIAVVSLDDANMTFLSFSLSLSFLRPPSVCVIMPSSQ